MRLSGKATYDMWSLSPQWGCLGETGVGLYQSVNQSMKHQFIKVAAASPALKVADPAYNAQKIIEVIEAQAEKGTEILVFPELSLSGYTCGDLFLQQTLLEGCLSALKRVAEATKGKIMLVFVGLPLAHDGKLYNCAAALSDGEVKGFVPKTHIPNYNEFYEARYFSPAPEGASWHRLGSEEDDGAYLSAELVFRDEAHPEIAVGCEICEDLWAPEPPSVRLAAKGAAIIVNLSASDETVGKREYRHKLLAAQSGKNVCAYVYCDAGEGESTSDMVFAGNNMVYENGVCLAESMPFSGEVCEAEADVGFLLSERRKLTTFRADPDTEDWLDASFVTEGDLTLRKIDPAPFVPHEEGARRERAERILEIQAHALARRISHIHARTAVLGISGGLDSTLALLVTCRAFDLLKKPREDILAVSMPGFGTTVKTKNNATALMQALGVTQRQIGISQTVLKHFKDIGHDPDELNTTYENAQARYRTMLLMDLAGDAGGLVVGTGDLSELALGWCTYNGDHMSMYAVNCSVPKTLVRYLVLAEAERLGGRAEVVLKGVLNTEISPELLPPDEAGNIAQKTEDLIGPYELHDFYLYRFLRRGDGAAKTLYLAERAFAGKYDRATLKKWLVVFYRRFFAQQFKRNCVPDGVKVGSVSLSPRADLRMPSDASATLWLEEAENL